MRRAVIAYGIVSGAVMVLGAIGWVVAFEAMRNEVTLERQVVELHLRILEQG